MISPEILGKEISDILILAEEKSPKRVIAVYAGRFQPFHSGHKSVYDFLANKFGKNNVYIATSNVIEYPKSPFSFNQKKHIISKMFGIPGQNIVQVKSSYEPVEIVRRFDPKKTAMVTAYSEKDAGRLDSSEKSYFQKYKDGTSLESYKDRGYYIVVPEFKMNIHGGNVSGTQVRETFGNPNISNEEKHDLFKKLYGKFDKDVFDLIVSKSTDAVGTAQLLKKVDPKQRIENPETKHKILVKTALSYDKTHPAHKAAEKLLTGEDKNYLQSLIERYTPLGDDMISRALLFEGGAAGHMSHVFEDMNLTFGDLKMIIDLGLEGHLDIEAPVTEKLDGQNIAVSYRSDRGVIFARNKGHTRNSGLGAIDVNGIKQMFAGRGQVSDAFSYAAEDLETAILALSDKQKNKIFANGKKFMSVEVIYPATQNVIPYGLKLLVFNNTIEYDESGNQIGTNKEDAQILSGMIKQVNANVQNTFQFRGPVVVKLPKAKNFSKTKTKYLSRLSKLQSEFGLKDSDPIMLYHQNWWDRYIDSAASKYKYAIPYYIKMGLIRRWAFNDLSLSIGEMKKTIKNDKFLDWALTFDKASKEQQAEQNIKPFETLFLQLGAEILSNASGLLAAVPGAEAIRSQVERVSNELENSKDISKISKLHKELERLNDIGLDKIVSSEGIVFVYKGKMYKLTGAFASINQLLGILKYAR